MQHNSTRLKGETIDVFASSQDLGTFSMYKIVGNVATDITGVHTIESISENIYKTEVTLPNEDCIVCCVLNGCPVFARVGEPNVQYITYAYGTGKVVGYERVDNAGGAIESGNLVEYGYGLYGFVPNSLVYSLIKVGGVTSTLDVPYESTEGTSGTIKLQRGVWQLIAIPREDTVAEYLCDRLAAQEGVEASELIEIVNTYRGSDDKFLSYVPGVTSKQSVNNFSLVYDDNGSNEIAGVWVKTKEWVHTAGDLIIDWYRN